jgi:hypothetical protein
MEWRIFCLRGDLVVRSVKAFYENGHLVFPEGCGPEGPMEVVVVFPDRNNPDSVRVEDAGKRFVCKWSGVLEGCDLGRWKDEKADYLRGKRSENPS